MTVVARVLPVLPVRSHGWRLVERNFVFYRRVWVAFLSGFLEPVF